MSLSPELPLNRSQDRPLGKQAVALIQGCWVELVALAAALILTWMLGTGLMKEMQDWDANGVVLLIGALWMAICVALYRFLAKTTR
jgi:hypothetical protein